MFFQPSEYSVGGNQNMQCEQTRFVELDAWTQTSQPALRPSSLAVGFAW